MKLTLESFAIPLDITDRELEKKYLLAQANYQRLEQWLDVVSEEILRRRGRSS